MDTTLTRFQVYGLHNNLDMDVLIRDNQLILVGENGTGKSTFVNLIYYFMTKQWVRIKDYRFTRICAHISGNILSLTPDDISQHISNRRNLASLVHQFRYTARARHEGLQEELFDLMSEFDSLSFNNEDEVVEKISSQLRLPSRVARELFQNYRLETKGKKSQIKHIERVISELNLGQFLYLPTYRRIEQDLRQIFKSVDLETDLHKFKERLGRRKGSTYIELVEFGMEDVEQTILTRMAQIKESVRQGLNNLTGTYLRDVIRGTHTKVGITSVTDLSAEALEEVMSRIDEATLPATDKAHLREKIKTISHNGVLEEQDKVVAHFLQKLSQLYKEQQENEKASRKFVNICNQYLTGKELVYDSTNYSIVIQQDTLAPDLISEKLPMQALSSGEKQIVSLFSHLYLSGQEKFFVVIDEPELSLSVPWQRRFLPDIIETGMCSGLLAVTHSPFVWENYLENHVRTLAEFTRQAN